MPVVPKRRTKPSANIYPYSIYTPLESLSEKKSRERKELVTLVKLFRIEIVPYSSYKKSRARYYVDSDEASRYSKYIYLKKACDTIKPLETS